jgi:hypothetical protein
MEGIPALYKGRVIPKENFRAYIYGYDGVRKLVNSWESFETHMQTGIWFVTKDEIKSRSQDVKLDKSKKDKIENKSVKDDFLPKEKK